MEIKNIVGAFFSTIIRLTIAVAVVYFLYNVGIEGYDFGYRVFADVPVEISPGRDKEISVVEGKSVKETGELLQNAGLIKDANIFWVQERLSEYHGKLQPGIYTLNTSMTSMEMMRIMSASGEEMEENKEE